MNQKNIFTIIGVILVLQGIIFYFMAIDIVSSSFADLDETGKHAPTILMQVMGVMSISLGLIAYASRNVSEVLWAFCIGFTLFCLVSLKHLLIDHINVPIPAVVLQILIVLACGYLLMNANKLKAS